MYVVLCCSGRHVELAASGGGCRVIGGGGCVLLGVCANLRFKLQMGWQFWLHWHFFTADHTDWITQRLCPHRRPYRLEYTAAVSFDPLFNVGFQLMVAGSVRWSKPQHQKYHRKKKQRH